jgi:hypothetical protein
VIGKIARIWDALAACFQANDGPLTKAQVFAWINNTYPDNDFHSGTLYHQLRRSCANRPSAQNYKAPKILLYDDTNRTYIRAAYPMFSPSLTPKGETPLEGDSDDFPDSTFALEGHLRDYLAKNLGTLEKGLHLWSMNPPSVEFAIENKRIDILAKDSQGRAVVIELKLNKGYDRVIGQALLYRGLLSRVLGQKQARIMLIANSVSEELKTACLSLSDVTLFEYAISMQVEKVNPSVSEES